MIRKKLNSLINQDAVESIIVYHEFGHLLTNVFFKNINREYAKLKGVEFYLIENQPPARVVSDPIHGLYVLCEKSCNFEMSVIDKNLCFPVLLGFASGNIFDDVFSNRGDFLSLLWSPYLMPHNDRNAITKVRRLAKIDISVLESVLINYKMIIEKHKASLLIIINDLCQFDIPIEGNLAFISDDVLVDFIKLVELKIPKQLLIDLENLAESFPVL